MAKLTVKNVGPIREAELEVKKHTVFIGPQGSGKSTLAKLIAICSYKELNLSNKKLLEEYNIHNYLSPISSVLFHADNYVASLENESLDYTITNEAKAKLADTRQYILNLPTEATEILEESILKLIGEMNSSGSQNAKIDLSLGKKTIDSLIQFLNSRDKSLEILELLYKEIGFINTTYIPAERALLAILSNSIWNLIHSNINLPRNILAFASDFEKARKWLTNKFDISFLGVSYEFRKGSDVITVKDNLIELNQSASGYQSTIPLLLVTEQQRKSLRHRFIIEEPELNLYPTAQKDLIYSLMGGLQPDVEYQDAEWVITTHSPYVLSSFNTLMLAYKVAQRSEELRIEVEKIIPSRCWINPDEFAAYYVDNGTVRSIISEKTCLIADNELDDVSEDLAGEQDQLFELNRSVPRA